MRLTANQIEVTKQELHHPAVSARLFQQQAPHVNHCRQQKYSCLKRTGASVSFCRANSTKSRQGGYSMVELVTTLVIVSILAAVAAPHFFDRNIFDSRGFYDQALSALRYAQKAAIAQHRSVCVTFGANSRITLTYNSTTPASSTCTGSPLSSPSGQASYFIDPPDGVTVSIVDVANNPVALPANFSFDALGRPLIFVAPPVFVLYGAPVPLSGLLSMKHTITVSGYPNPITVEEETGYVH
jgi:MSHA pilin protein MshC